MSKARDSNFENPEKLEKARARKVKARDDSRLEKIGLNPSLIQIQKQDFEWKQQIVIEWLKIKLSNKKVNC